MKKLSSKQELIVCIAIILVAVIITIVITTNIIKNNKVANEGYAATTANANSNLVANYIKKGITIGGITGTLESLDTSDATASPEDIALGKTAYVDGKKIIGTRDDREKISKSLSYVGYYADIDDNGTVDGIIYADLAIGGGGQWVNTNGNYEVDKIQEVESIKDYYISQSTYEGKLGTKSVISLIGGEKERFYVMALEDIDEIVHYFYYNGYMTDYATATSKDFEKGMSNTITMINKWKNSEYGTQNSNDVWALIQEKVERGWFVPSIEEWAAFAGNLEINTSNFGEKGIQNWYWSSSQFDTTHSWYINFNVGQIFGSTIDWQRCYISNSLYIRLSTVF